MKKHGGGGGFERGDNYEEGEIEEEQYRTEYSNMMNSHTILGLASSHRREYDQHMVFVEKRLGQTLPFKY